MAEDGSDKPALSSADSPSAGLPSAEERRAILDRAVKDATREFRASPESKGEFEAVLVRGQRVNHLLHFVVLAAILAIVAGLGRILLASGPLLLIALVLGGGYGVFWATLALTGGLERERLEVDEQGAVSRTFSGRRVGTRDRALKVAIPAAIILVGGSLSLTLAYDIVIPPPPHCSLPWSGDADPCFKLPSFDTAALAQPTAGSSAQPAELDRYMSVGATRTLERLIRGFGLIVALGTTLLAAWFLRRMLNGKGLLWLEAVRSKRE